MRKAGKRNMDKSKSALAFLEKHGMQPEAVDPDVCIGSMLEEMKSGLAGGACSMDMIPTWLTSDGVIRPGDHAVVIDAGGTNFRRALVRFEQKGYTVLDLARHKMPGIDRPCSWEEFIRFAADEIEPLMDRADVIGFCFSYAAEITPEMDGRVITIDKEVVITGCEGRLIGASLLAELGRRGIRGKHIVILNDTVAVLLGMTAGIDKSQYSAFIGQVSGTGSNTCVSLPVSAIGKLGLTAERRMIVNLESGKYSGIEGGDFDRMLDAASHNPGQKRFEKLTAGVYLGEICRLMLHGAAKEGLLSAPCAERVLTMGHFDASVVDAWACGERLEELGDEEDRRFLQTLCLSLFERSARCMCVNLLALAELAGGGRDKPVDITAEGSLVQKGRCYRPELERLLTLYGTAGRGIRYELHVGSETTLPGSAAAALLNAGKGL